MGITILIAAVGPIQAQNKVASNDNSRPVPVTRAESTNSRPVLVADLNSAAAPKPTGVPAPTASVPRGGVLHGTVLLPDGKPAVGAQVGIRNSWPDISITDGKLEPHNFNKSVAKADADGQFSVPMEEAAKVLYAVSEAGIASLPAANCTNGLKLVLEPWARIEGAMWHNQEQAKGQGIELTGLQSPFAIPTFHATTVTDAEGGFVFSNVPPGRNTLYHRSPRGDGWVDHGRIFVTVEPGQSLGLNWGGDGRPVTGKCVVENMADVPDGTSIEVSLTLPEGTSRGVKMIRNAYEAGRFDGDVAATDRRFQVDDVPAGTYDLRFFASFDAPEKPGGAKRLFGMPKRITVPGLPDSGKCEPFDLGNVKVTFVEPTPHATVQLKQGDIAPAFKTKALDGSKLNLSEFAGKYVLLDVGFILPDDESEQIAAVNKSYRNDDRLVIISLCEYADEEYLKKLPSGPAAHWVQGVRDWEGMRKSYAFDGVPSPLIMLIDPKGKIVATGLHGGQIASTVASVLAK